ncbi:hypothetical protein [Cognatiyoonia sp. IB215182]|uniref:BP74-related protein n=1 Tax=Cognatiyoonia sp. IB215182 TaxID=3097353 RepID=UPI002A0C3DC0|nr:hypothetical protein [Cognatiyoonia sp. IB215182]MDX8355658.1 hypothetical protein [Cognatiyoonia sp. IB215182]
MSNHFIGHSASNDLTEALNDAIAKAKSALTTDYVRWKLDFVNGEAGGFVIAEDLYVGIHAEGPNKNDFVGPAYFEMIDIDEKPFVIKLVGEDQIRVARRILAGEEKERIHIQGTIIPSTASYNPGWSYHLDPTSIDFFAFAVEVCDAASTYVEENLADIGGAFLPGNHWCPWSSELKSELTFTELAERTETIG